MPDQATRHTRLPGFTVGTIQTRDSPKMSLDIGSEIPLYFITL